MGATLDNLLCAVCGGQLGTGASRRRRRRRPVARSRRRSGSWPLPMAPAGVTPRLTPEVEWWRWSGINDTADAAADDQPRERRPRRA